MNIDDLRSRVSVICKRNNIKRLDLFGSRSRKEENQESDFDFVVVLPDSPPSEYARQFFCFLHDMEDELHERIDLLTEASIKRKSLKEKINRDRIRLYEI